MEAMLYTEAYDSYVLSAQTLATLLIAVVMLSERLRDTLVINVLGLVWLLTGLTYYLDYLGGLYGVSMALLCALQAVAMIVNWAKLRERKLCFTFDFCKFKVDLQSISTSASILGASTMLVKVS